VADAAGADADKHFDEVGARNGEERDVGFTGDRAGQQSFAGAWRFDEENALRNATAQLLEFLRVFQELDDFLKLFLSFVGSGHILKSCFLLLRGKQAGAGLAETESLIASSLHLAHQEEAEAHQKKQR